MPVDSVSMKRCFVIGFTCSSVFPGESNDSMLLLQSFSLYRIDRHPLCSSRACPSPHLFPHIFSLLSPIRFPPNGSHSPQTYFLSADWLQHAIRVMNKNRETHANSREISPRNQSRIPDQFMESELAKKNIQGNYFLGLYRIEKNTYIRLTGRSMGSLFYPRNTWSGYSTGR